MRADKHFYPAEYGGICVVRRNGESDEDVIRRFRKKYSKSGISRELRDRMYFEKPSDKKRRKKSQSIRLKEKEDEKLKDQRDRSRLKRFRGKKKNLVKTQKMREEQDMQTKADIIKEQLERAKKYSEAYNKFKKKEEEKRNDSSDRR
jgi:small subunit ribosomal protein S21